MPDNNIDGDLLRLTEADLYEMIGDELSGKPMFPFTRDELIERGQAWFDAHLDQIRSVVCPHAKTFTDDNDVHSILIAVADLLAGVIFNITPVTAAALVIKIGVKKLCKVD